MTSRQSRKSSAPTNRPDICLGQGHRKIDIGLRLYVQVGTGKIWPLEHDHNTELL
jgi:hypothetical protein